SKTLARTGDDDQNGVEAIHADPELRELHEEWLPERRPRPRGQTTADRALAEAKLADAESIEDAVQWLNSGERLVALGDRALLSMIARLPRREKSSETPKP
ncbi:MAG TPA: glucan biosynthesis glucosyltransferase H, partial [Methylocystis sp.]|nr:glucan biosynthesis glucosyltransferase H [Methylocystis sp.]